MREYGTISPRFWIGETGKQLRGNTSAQLLALYLMTSPHSTMTGVFHCPVLYMAHETGLGMEGASEALQSLLQVGFCEYEESSETVFVLRMAAYQIGESLKPSDNRVAGLRKEVDRMPAGRMKSRFLAVYGAAFNLIEKPETPPPKQAPPKPLRSQEQEQEQEQDPSPPLRGEGRFPEFWATWPSSSRKQDRKKCLEKWRRHRWDAQAEEIIRHVEQSKQSKQWRDGYEPAPLTYLNGERWKDGETPSAPAADERFAGAV